MLKSLSDDYKIAILQDTENRSPEIGIIQSALDEFINFIQTEKNAGTTFVQLSETTGLTIDSINQYIHDNVSWTTWAMAAKQARFIASLSDPNKSEKINRSTAHVQNVIQEFITSPLPSNALSSYYSLKDLKISVPSIEHAKSINISDPTDNPIWSLNYRKILLLFNILEHDETFKIDNHLYQEALHFIDTNGVGALVFKFFAIYRNKSLREISRTTGISIGTLSKWKNAEQDYWEISSITPTNILKIWTSIQ